VPAGRVLILVLGSDFRLRKGFRTDVVMLLSVDTWARSVTAISFPRDLYVLIPGGERNRINTAMQRGGFDLLAETFQVNFGLRPDFYVMADMQAFAGIVESLDGVTVDVGQALRDKCDRSLDLADDEGYCEVGDGPMNMDGGTALWYVRSRYSTSDFDRLRRAQEVLLAIFSKLMSLNAIAHWPEVYAEYGEHVQTNIEIGDIVQMLPAAWEIYRAPTQIRRYAITRTEVTPFTTANGASVLLPNYTKIREILDQAVFAP
jgi:LCP family protein required for cell wall assembly